MKVPKRLLLFCLATVFCGAAAMFIGLTRWRSEVQLRHDRALRTAATEALRQHRAADVLALLAQRTPPAGESAEESTAWTRLEIQAAAETAQLPRLAALFQRAPEAVLADENASLLLARGFTHTRDAAALGRVTAAWAQRGQPVAWLMLEADRLLLEGQRAEALALLAGHHFEGAADVPRLVRLALLAAGRDLTEAWNLLAQAEALDSRNAEVRLFRGQILERLGKLPLARVEYVAAYLSDPRSSWLADQLAEFHRRHGDFAAAAAIWGESLQKEPVDYLWLKARFWSRVALPQRDSLPPPPTAGTLAKLNASLAALAPETFWNPRWTEEEKTLGEGRQERFWLALIEDLRSGREADAEQKLRAPRAGGDSWEPRLELALARILSFRRQGQVNGPVAAGPAPGGHRFFAELEEAARAERAGQPAAAELRVLLESQDAFASAFIAAGWLNAGVALTTSGPLPAGLPDWVAFAQTQALRFTRGPEAALRFALRQSTTPALVGLVAEIHLGLGQENEARTGLQEAAQDPGEAGFRAAWLLATAALEKKDFASTVQAIATHRAFRESTTGREMLARVAWLENRRADAEAAYQELEGESVEARAFLARTAYARRDWATARRLTTALLADLPDEMQLRANLLAIAREEAR